MRTWIAGFDMPIYKFYANHCRTARRLALTRQKMKQIAIRSEILRAQYMAEMSAFDPDMLVFIDETGCEKCNSIRH